MWRLKWYSVTGSRDRGERGAAVGPSQIAADGGELRVVAAGRDGELDVAISEYRDGATVLTQPTAAVRVYSRPVPAPSRRPTPT